MEPVWTKNGQPPIAMWLDGRKVYKSDLPPSETRRWSSRRKAEIVGAVATGLLTREEALERYGISSQEFEAWYEVVKRHGSRGLRALHAQEYRESRGGTVLPDKGILRAGAVELDQKAQTIRLGEARINLTPTESNLLALLVARAGTLVTKEMMLDALYGKSDREPKQKILDVLICKIRLKLKAKFGSRIIETVWGRGYTIPA